MDAARQLRSAARRVLLVEDDYLQANALASQLGDLGIDVVGPVGSVAQALQSMAANQPLEGAILDVNLGGEWSYPIACTLKASGVPFVFWTGYDDLHIPESLDSTGIVLKPGCAEDLVRALFRPARPAVDELASVYRDANGEWLLVFGAHHVDAASDAPRWVGAGFLSRAAWTRTLRLALRDGVFYRVPPRHAVALKIQLNLLG